MLKSNAVLYNLKSSVMVIAGWKECRLGNWLKQSAFYLPKINVFNIVIQSFVLRCTDSDSVLLLHRNISAIGVGKEESSCD